MDLETEYQGPKRGADRAVLLAHGAGADMHAAALTVVAGNNQSAPIDSTLAIMLAVKVTDQYGNVVPNATVQWSDDAGGTLSATTSVADENGIAQVQYTLGSTPGAEDVVATLTVSTASTTTSFVEIGN